MTLSLTLHPSTFIWESRTNTIHITRRELFPQNAPLTTDWHEARIDVLNPVTGGTAGFTKFTLWRNHYVSFMAQVPHPKLANRKRTVKLTVWNDYDTLRANYHKHK